MKNWTYLYLNNWKPNNVHSPLWFACCEILLIPAMNCFQEVFFVYFFYMLYLLCICLILYWCCLYFSRMNDVIVKVNNDNVVNCTHADAVDALKRAGTRVVLVCTITSLHFTIINLNSVFIPTLSDQLWDVLLIWQTNTINITM